MRLGNALHHRQTDPGALYPAGLGVGAAHKSLEDGVLLVYWYAEAVVSDGDGDPVLVLPHVQPDGVAVGRVLDRVIEQVPYGAGQGIAVPAYIGRAGR